MLEDCQDKSLSAYAPADPRCSLCLDAFLHGDPVPGNVISTKAGAVLIDWQCPARGDPVLDLFLAASPGMRAIYGGSIELEALLSAYGAPSVTERFRTLAPLLHWRMAVYGQWKMEHGDPAYAVVRDAEKRALGI
jgi:aminoglycoside phosphotransferase (APT) family kinase protein